MGSKIKETLLKLLSATNYSLDNISEADLSSFNNMKHLNPLFEWLSQNLSEANCVTPEELKEYKELQKTGKVKYGEELDEAIQARFTSRINSSVPINKSLMFKESLEDATQELALLKEQLHYKLILLKNLCSENAAMTHKISALKEQRQNAEVEQKQKIEEICKANNSLKDTIAETQASISELGNDIIGLAQNGGGPEVSQDEGIHSLTSDNLESNQSISSDVWSQTTGSSWHTIRTNDSSSKYLCQLTLDKYKALHKQFLKRLTKLVDNLSKVGKLQSNSSEHKELLVNNEALEKQMFALIQNEAEIEGIQAARLKVRELKKAVENNECLLTRIRYEESKLDNRMEYDCVDPSSRELADTCRQWALLQTFRVVELKQRERIKLSKNIIKKMDEILNPLMLKLKADKVLSEIFQYEKERIAASVNLYKSFHLSLLNQYNRMRVNIDKMQTNFEDYERFCAIPLEERNALLEQLASIVLSDKEGVVKAVQDLKASSLREHETMLEHYVQEKNKLITSGVNKEELSNLLTDGSNNDGGVANVGDSVQQRIHHLNCGIQEVNNNIHEVIYSIANEKKE